MADTKIRDEDLIALCASLRAREVHMLNPELVDRMLEARQVSDSVKMLMECGYPEMKNADVFALEDLLSERRRALYEEIWGTPAARPIVSMFMLKYDYHNVKALVKSMGANEDATRILSASGRVPADVLTEAFITGERDELPPALSRAMSEGVGALSRTSNPQISDINADRHYFAELLNIAQSADDEVVEGYVRILIDSANLRTFVRAARTGKTPEFLERALFNGGNISAAAVAAISPEGNEIAEVFHGAEFKSAVVFAKDVIAGGSQTQFERACDNAVAEYVDRARFVPFGKSVVLRHLLAVDWEMTTIRMILSGRLAGVAPETIRERLRDAYV
ncbi:MAG: V-type ATPase subunit [Clostridiales bacterium]|nr:V-type ATPase subunit [Clostridiales bacterium]